MLDECQPDIRDRKVRTFFRCSDSEDETASARRLMCWVLAANRHPSDDGNVENADMGNVRFREPKGWTPAAGAILSVIPTDVRSLVAMSYLTG